MPPASLRNIKTGKYKRRIGAEASNAAGENLGAMLRYAGRARSWDGSGHGRAGANGQGLPCLLLLSDQIQNLFRGQWHVRTRSEYGGNAGLLQERVVLLRDDAAADDEDVVGAFGL